jgi:hypothetical protein
MGGAERRENPRFSTGEDARFTFLDFPWKLTASPRRRVPEAVIVSVGTIVKKPVINDAGQIIPGQIAYIALQPTRIDFSSCSLCLCGEFPLRDLLSKLRALINPQSEFSSPIQFTRRCAEMHEQIRRKHRFLRERFRSQLASPATKPGAKAAGIVRRESSG